MSNRRRSGWFKHFGDASEGSTIRSLWAKKDTDSIALWWLVHEMICKWTKDDSPGEITISWSVLERETSWTRSKLERKCLELQPISELTFTLLSDDLVRINQDNWLKYQPSWGGKRASRFEQDGRRTKNKEVRNKNKETTLASNDSDESFKALACYSSLAEIFTERKVTSKLQECWTKSFPESEWVTEQVRLALSWEASNPSKRKKNFGRFITGWLTRGWDRRRFGSSTKSINTQSIKVEKDYG